MLFWNIILCELIWMWFYFQTYASIVENAIKWKIKIISYEGALKYIERELKNMPDSVKHAASAKVCVPQTSKILSMFKCQFGAERTRMY